MLWVKRFTYCATTLANFQCKCILGKGWAKCNTDNDSCTYEVQNKLSNIIFDLI